MILQFRKFSKSIFAAIILGLVGLAMVLWLPSGQFSAITSNDIAKVGNYTVTPFQLTRELQRNLRIRREQTGQSITQQEAIDAGLHNQILDQLINRLSFYAYADKIGVSASDRQVAEAIRQIPQVMNPVTGQFDTTSYNAFLRQIEYSQPEFEAVARGDMTQQMLIEALVAGARSPTSYGALMFSYQTESRVISLAALPASSVGRIEPPNDEQLQAFYTENAANLRLPEFRVLTFVIARPEDFVGRVTVSEEDLEAEVEARRQSIAQPERRTYVRITAQSEQQANEISQRLARGEAPEAIAQALGVQSQTGENQARDEVLDAAVAEAVFSIPAGAPARVVRGRLAPYVVVRVDSVQAAPPVDVAALRAQLREAIALDQAADLLNDAIGAFEDARSSGAGAAEAARAHGLSVLTTPPVTADARNQQGQVMEALAPLAEPMRVAFETVEGEATDFLPFDGGDVMVEVDQIIPASVRPLEEVREPLIAGWVNRERVRRMQAKGAEIAAAIREGRPFAEVARANNMRIIANSQQVTRQTIGEQIPVRAMPAQIFQARQGETAVDITADGSQLLVAVVERINRANPQEAPELVEQVRSADQRVLTNALAETVFGEIVRQMRPSRNERVLDRNFVPSVSE